MILYEIDGLKLAVNVISKKATQNTIGILKPEPSDVVTKVEFQGVPHALQPWGKWPCQVSTGVSHCHCLPLSPERRSSGRG